MLLDNLENFKRGWVVGNFSPSVLHQPNCEFGIQSYSKGDLHKSHYHLECTEVNIIISGLYKITIGIKEGCCRLDLTATPGTILVVEPKEVCGLQCLEPGQIACFKTHSNPKDKFDAPELSPLLSKMRG